MRHNEEALQTGLVQILFLYARPSVIWYAVPNGGQRSKAAAAKLKAQGVRAGVPDLAFVLPDGRAAFMELKIATGRLSPAQIAFQQHCERFGIEHAVCYSIDSALAVLRAWNVLKGNVQ